MTQDHVPDHEGMDFGYDLRAYENGVLEIEVWPKSGRWMPFVAVVPVAERALLNAVSFAKRGQQHVDMQSAQRVDVDAGDHAGIGIHNPITSDVSARLYFARKPGEVHFGQVGKPLHALKF
jgi:hypothetical protein